MNSNEPPYPDFLQLFAWVFNAALKRWRMLARFVAVGILVGLAFAFFLPVKYDSFGVILPPDKKTSLPSLGDLGQSLITFTGVNVGGNYTRGEEVELILLSKDLQEEVIAHFRLDTVFNPKGKKVKLADYLKKFNKALIVEEHETAGMRIRYRDKSPERAKLIVERMIQLADSAFIRFQTDKAALNAKYTEQQIKISQQSLDSLLALMNALQKTEKVIDPKTQVESSVKLYAEVEQKIVTASANLEKERNTNGTHSPLYKSLSSELNALRKELQALQSKGSSSGTILALPTASKAVLEYEQLQAEIKVQTEIYKGLRVAYEQEKFDSSNKVQRITVLQEPWVNEKKTFPPRKPILIASTVLSLIAAIFSAVFSEYLANEKERNSRTWQLLQSSFVRKK